MLGRIFHPRPLDTPAHTRTALSYSPLDLAILSLCAQSISYYVRTGHWPRLTRHDAPDGWEVWTE